MMSFLFSAKGRISRKQFWLNFVLPLIGIYLVVVVVAGALFGFSGVAAGGEPNPIIFGVIGLIAIPLYIAIVWASICVSAKRFHDRNMSGWWVLWFFLIGLAVAAAQYGAIMALGPDVGGMIAMVATVISMILSLVQLVILGFLPGTKGPNKYGADPRDPTGAASAEEVFG